MSYIELKDVSRIYRSGDVSITAADHISFCVEKGELALMSIELDSDAPDSICPAIENFAHVESCTLLHAL